MKQLQHVTWRYTAKDVTAHTGLLRAPDALTLHL